MFGYYFKEIETTDELMVFKERYEAAVAGASKGKITTSVAVEYLERAQLLGFFDKTDDLVGGFILNFTDPMLVLGTIPDEAAASWLAKVSPAEQCELVGIWKARHLSQHFSGLFIWPRIIRECALSGRKHILGLGYDNRMNEVYGIARPQMIYAGIRTDKPELNQFVSVYAYTPITITLTYFVNFLTELIIKPPRRMLRRLFGSGGKK